MGLLEKKELSSIKVTEIVEEAGIGRGTFYLHYKDVYDLHEKIETELYTDLAIYIDEASQTDKNEKGLMKLMDNLVSYIDEHREVFGLIMKDKSYKDSGRKFNEIVVGRVLEGYFPAHELNALDHADAVEVIFIVSGVAGVIEEWLKGGLKYPKEQIADAVHGILEKFD